MAVFCLIISIVAGFFAGCIFLWSGWVKNGDQKNWDETYQELNKNQPVEVPEEVVYDVIMKCRYVSGIVLCICILLAAISIFNLVS